MSIYQDKKQKNEINSINELRPAPYNPRRISDKAAKGLKRSIEKFGDIGGITWNRCTGNLVTGHQRVDQLKKLGAKLDNDCLVYDGKRFKINVVDWDDIQEKAANVAANNDAIGGVFENLDDVLKDIKIGLNDEDCNGLLIDKLAIKEKVNLYGYIDEDEIPEPPKEPKTKIGDIWKLGRHRLMCGDILEHTDMLLKNKKVDIVIADPPYGVSYSNKNSFLNSFDEGNRIQKEIKNDNVSEDEINEFWLKCFEKIKTTLSPINSYYFFGQQINGMMMMMKAGLPSKHVVIWVKNNHVLGRCDYNYRHEPIFFGWTTKHEFYGGGEFKTSVWEVDKPLKNDLHPTMKPVRLLINMLLNSSKENQLCLDPFLGSGTTLIACEKTNRICYGMEIEPAYCDVIIERWQNLTGKKAVKE